MSGKKPKKPQITRRELIRIAERLNELQDEADRRANEAGGSKQDKWSATADNLAAAHDAVETVIYEHWPEKDG